MTRKLKTQFQLKRPLWSEKPSLVSALERRQIIAGIGEGAIERFVGVAPGKKSPAAGHERSRRKKDTADQIDWSLFRGRSRSTRCGIEVSDHNFLGSLARALRRKGDGL